MRSFFVLFIISLLLSCNKKIQKSDSAYKNPTYNKQTYNVEDFRKSGMSDYETLKAAYDSVPNNSTLLLASRTYILDHTLYIYKYLNFYGPATLKREDQITYTLKEPADESSTMLVVNNADGLMVKDRFLLTFGQSNDENTALNMIIQKFGDTLILAYPIGKTTDGRGIYPVETKLFKDINFFCIADDNAGPTDQGCSFNSLIFDGNRDNNSGSYSWLLNSAIMAPIRGTTRYKYCTFLNSPGETIVGHNADIRNCNFLNLNGSAFHTSSDKMVNAENDIHSYLSDNKFENTNQILNSIGGHSEGAITHSNSGGYYTAVNNTFINVGECVLGGLYPSVSIHDWGTSNITFTGNTINGAGSLVRFISMLPGTIHDVKIEKNIISNMPRVDWTFGLEHWPGIILKDKSGE